MLHLRITVPPERRDEVLAVLEPNAGVANIAVLPGASIRPEGDLILADVARECADDVIDGLLERHIDAVGTITINAIDTAISHAAERAEDSSPADGADAVIWEQVVRRSDEESVLSVTFVAFLAIAAMLASVAIVLDSAVLIVGAMVLGPEFGPIAAVAVAMVHRRAAVLRQAALTLAVGFIAAIVITTLAALAARGFGWIDGSLITAERPQTGFIIEPDRWSALVAFLAGVAGVLSLTSSKSGALVGVLISVTTVPAAANIALGLALGATGEVTSSLLQLGINVSAIMVAGIATMLVQKAVWRHAPHIAPRPGSPPRR